jgi:ankyrin repeat protein
MKPDPKPHKGRYDIHGPLPEAAVIGRLDICTALVDAGTDVEYTTSESVRGTPLAIAANRGHVEVVAYLLGVGADPNGRGHHPTYRLATPTIQAVDQDERDNGADTGGRSLEDLDDEWRNTMEADANENRGNR